MAEGRRRGEQRDGAMDGWTDGGGKAGAEKDHLVRGLIFVIGFYFLFSEVGAVENGDKGRRVDWEGSREENVRVKCVRGGCRGH